MRATKRVTIYLDAELDRALRLKSAETDQAISDIVNEAVRVALAGDDLAAIEDRKSEPTRPFASFVKDLRRRGRP